MSLFLKRILMVLLGVMGALMIWPCLLTVQYFQGAFRGYFAFSLVQGIVLGLVFGAIFGSFEGLVVSSRPKAFKGMLFGAIAGTFAGAFGVMAGQSFLFKAAEEIFKSGGSPPGFAIAFANGIGWALIGAFIAMIEGLRSGSVRKVFVGLGGGIVGGLIGGITLQAFLYYFPGNPVALLAGLVLFGFSLSFFYTLFENRFSLGSVKLLNGPLRNKEYHLSKSRMSIGSSDSCDIVLSGYRDVAPVHAIIVLKKGRVVFSPAGRGNTVRVNDEKKDESPLRREDVFAIGNAKFMYGIFS